MSKPIKLLRGALYGVLVFWGAIGFVYGLMWIMDGFGVAWFLAFYGTALAMIVGAGLYAGLK